MQDLSYNYLYLYVIHASHRGITTLPCYYRINGLDSLGSRIWGDNGILVTSSDTLNIYDSYLIADSNGGVTSIFVETWTNYYDVYAKRINNDGSLGGPNAPIEDLTISVEGEDIVLSWSSKAAVASYYVYKSFQPYSFLAVPDTAISDTFFVDVEGLLEGIGFYDVRWEP